MQTGFTELQDVLRRGIILLPAAILLQLILVADLASAKLVNGTSVGSPSGVPASAADFPLAKVRAEHNGPPTGVVESLKDTLRGSFSGEAGDVLTARPGFKMHVNRLRQRLRNSTKRCGQATGQEGDNLGMLARSARGERTLDLREAQVGNDRRFLLCDQSQLCQNRGPPIGPQAGFFQTNCNSLNFRFNSGLSQTPHAGAGGSWHILSSSRGFVVSSHIAVRRGEITNQGFRAG